MNSTALREAMALALLVLVVTALGFRDRLDATALSAWVEDAVAADPVVLVAVCAAAAVLFLPGALFTLAGGALFGAVRGSCPYGGCPVEARSRSRIGRIDRIDRSVNVERTRASLAALQEQARPRVLGD